MSDECGVARPLEAGEVDSSAAERRLALALWGRPAEPGWCADDSELELDERSAALSMMPAWLGGAVCGLLVCEAQGRVRGLEC